MNAGDLDFDARSATLAVLAAALGYFVDAYDLVLYNIVRVPSLKALGVSGHALLTTGVDLLNLQLAGMLLGGVLWGCGETNSGGAACFLVQL